MVPPYLASRSSAHQYRGIAWYRRTFDTPSNVDEAAVRIEFEAVFHSARVWINEKLVGEHTNKGYTAFTFPAGELLRAGAANTITVRVDNAFNEHMLPRGRSSDSAQGGGISRPVQLLVTPKIFFERVDVDALPDLAAGNAQLDITAFITNRGGQSFRRTVPCVSLTRALA